MSRVPVWESRPERKPGLLPPPAAPKARSESAAGRWAEARGGASSSAGRWAEARGGASFSAGRVATPLSPSSTTVLPEWQFAAIRHKEQVRIHLKPRLRYPSIRVEGTVRLRLSLTAKGILQRVEVLASSDPRLTEAVLRDAQSAAPYPGFSPVMKRRTASYEFLVRYQPE